MRKSFSLGLVLTFLLLLMGGVVLAGPQGAWIKSPASPVLRPGPRDSWDHDGIWSLAVIQDGATYKMWYVGLGAEGVWAIGYATSSNGLTWNKHANNPVLTPGIEGSWDEFRVSDPTVIKNGAMYEIWYQGQNLDKDSAIGHATSPDGTTWTKDTSNPVLSRGPSGSWDGESVQAPSVVKRSTTYEMWYMGYDADGQAAIGRAYSLDGRLWTHQPFDPVLELGGPGTWDENSVSTLSVLYDTAAGQYQMWYGASGSEAQTIGYAFSVDGLTWRKYADNPVLRPGLEGSWDGAGVFNPAVIQEGTTYNMWYTGFGLDNYTIGKASASPGGSITGHVYDAGANPLRHTSIHVLDGNLNTIAAVESKGDGSYTIPDLPTGSYYLEASHKAHGREYYVDSYNIAGATPVNVTVPSSTPNIDFSLAPGGSILGRVLQADGKSRFGAGLVEVTPLGGGRPLVTGVLGNGTYSLGDLSTGMYEAWVGHSSYLADTTDAPIAVTQPLTSTVPDMILYGPYFPLANVGATYDYAWSNTVHHPQTIRERWELMGRKWYGKSGYGISAGSDLAWARVWFRVGVAEVAVRKLAVDAYADSFPDKMISLISYLIPPLDIMTQPLLLGATWSGPDYQGSQADSTVVRVDEVLTVGTVTYRKVLHIRTMVFGQDDYLTGQRDSWFAPEVGLIKLTYRHGDGSITTGVLSRGPYYDVLLPMVVRNHAEGRSVATGHQ